MKTLITGLFALTLMFGYSLNVQAQVNDATINTSASLLAELVWSDTRDIVFGNVSKNNVATISPTDGSTANASTGQTGLANLTGAPGTPYNVTFPSTVELAPGVGADRIYLHLNVTTRNGVLGTDAFGGTQYTSGNQLTFESTGENAGKSSFFLGGTLSGAEGSSNTVIPTGHTDGAYTGTFTLTATYN